jgi:hypothetical protein
MRLHFSVAAPESAVAAPESAAAAPESAAAAPENAAAAPESNAGGGRSVVGVEKMWEMRSVWVVFDSQRGAMGPAFAILFIFNQRKPTKSFAVSIFCFIFAAVYKPNNG